MSSNSEAFERNSEVAGSTPRLGRRCPRPRGQLRARDRFKPAGKLTAAETFRASAARVFLPKFSGARVCDPPRIKYANAEFNTGNFSCPGTRPCAAAHKAALHLVRLCRASPSAIQTAFPRTSGFVRDQATVTRSDSVCFVAFSEAHFNPKLNLKTEVEPTGANRESRGEKTGAHKYREKFCPTPLSQNPFSADSVSSCSINQLGVRIQRKTRNR